MFCVVLSSNSGSSPAVMVTHYGIANGNVRTGHIVYSSYNTLYGHSLSGGGLVTLKALIISLTVHTHDVICGARSRVWRRFKSKLRLTRKPTLRCVCA